jgi:hypothetical protein
MTAGPQMCTVDDLVGGTACLRVARWVWHPVQDDHLVYLCNFHAEPLEPVSAIAGRPIRRSAE